MTPSRSRANPYEKPRPCAARSCSKSQPYGIRNDSLLTDERKTLRHDADDRARDAVHSDRRADDIGSPAESRLPEVVADHHHLVVALQVFVGGICASDGRLDAKSREDIRGGDHALDLFRRVADDEAQSRRAGHPEVLERSRPFAPGDEIGLSDDIAANVPSGIGFPDRDDTIGILIRQRLEHHAADDAQRRRGRANAERERQNGWNRKARGADERPQRKPQILQQSAHDRLLRPITRP